MSKSWKDWKTSEQVIEDNSGFVDTDILAPDEATEALKQCKVRELAVSSCVDGEHDTEITVEEWKAEYQLFQENPPEEGDFIFTEDGSPLKLDIEYHKGKPPLIFARIYIPNIVGSRLGWFARKIGDNSPYGWKVILVPRVRDLVIRKVGITATEVPVKRLRILRRALNNTSYVAEIDQW